MDLQDGDLLFSTIREAIQLQDTEQRHAASMTTARDMMMREFAKKLRDAQQILENTLEEHEEHRVRSSKRARESLGTSIDITELVSYAHKISYTTFAPPEYASGQIPLRGALPPAPQEEQIRASQLYQAIHMDIGIPKPALISLAPISDTMLESIKLRNDEELSSPKVQRISSSLIPTELPPMPPGWKPGDPIPLPPGFELPALPQGWKPGDAVVLPPSSSLAKPSDLQGVLKPTPSTVAPPPVANSGIIQVPFVQLDLNPELEEDYGSEYSDDDGSSDEDED